MNRYACSAMTMLLVLLCVDARATPPGAALVRAMDPIAERLQHSEIVSQARAEAIFHAGGSVVVGHYNYGIMGDASLPTSDIVDYRNVDGRMGRGIDYLQLEVIGSKRSVLRLEVHFRPGVCINALAVIARYGLKLSPPPEPNPGARAVEYARTYPGGNLWLNVPVPPANLPFTMVNKASCVSEIGILSSVLLPLRR